MTGKDLDQAEDTTERDLATIGGMIENFILTTEDLFPQEREITENENQGEDLLSMAD